MGTKIPYPLPSHHIPFTPIPYHELKGIVLSHSPEYHKILLTSLQKVAHYLVTVPYEWGTAVVEVKDSNWLERLVSIFKILREEKSKVVTMPVYAPEIYEALETIATIRKNKRCRFEIDVTNLFKFIKAQVHKELQEMKKQKLISTPPSEERYIHMLEVTNVIADYNGFLDESGESTELDQMRVLVKDLKFYASFLPEYLLERLNIISPNPCPFPKTGNNYGSWNVAGIYFEEVVKMKNAFVEERNKDLRYAKVIAERIHTLYKKMVDFLKWLKEELFRVIVLVHGEKFAEYIRLREE